MCDDLKAHAIELEDQRSPQPLVVFNYGDPHGRCHRARIAVRVVF
jgi:hypothetical protein